MSSSPSKLHQWFDSEFFKMGAFLTSVDGEIVTVGKGGAVSYVSEFKHSHKPVFYLKDFFAHSYLAYTPATILECTKDELEEYLAELKTTKSHFSATDNDDDIYQKDFESLKAAFNQGLEKVVLVSRETYGTFEGEETIKRLFKKAFDLGTGIPYGFWHKDYGVIGSTPEPLYEVDFDELKTIALAGTAKVGQEKALLDSAKDRHEHNLVIKDIQEKLKPFAHDLKVHETVIHPFKNIIHLRTEIEALVDDSLDYTELTNALSPTEALGGYPQKTSLNFLKHSTYSGKYPERYFGSCFGLISEDTKEFVVSIRNIQWRKQFLFIESGGGVVAESDFKKELEEIHLKRETIRKHYL